MEFTKVHENMEDMYLKPLEETKRTETMNNAMPFEETLQPSAILSKSDTSICIQKVHSEKASAVAHLETIEEKSLSLQDIEIFPTKETDATFTLLSNNVIRQSENERNSTFDGKDKRLSESQRLEVIAKSCVLSAPSKRSLAREYGETKTKTFRASVGRFSELEDILYLWIDSMRRASLPVPPSLVIAKAKQITQQLSISEDDFQASWQWLSRFRACRGLQKVVLLTEGAEVD
ncbi:unnamed protein product [Clavelina lepadiformis]|uniref:HTH CENPB-type domain-containing protein n=1 Tax=Clavelina lepadiformis TaxID=159417 RepID=A0ABP0G3X2_CLALP